MTFLRPVCHAFLMGTAAALFIAPAARAADAELTVFDWAGFEAPALYQKFVTDTGDEPTFALYGDDDEAYQKLASGFKADIAHPCSQMVSKYRDAGLIEPWDTTKIPNFDKIDAKFLNSPVFKDDTGVWYIPTDWGATAIAYNTETVPAEDVASLQIFVNPAYQGRTTIPDSSDDAWALAYLATGVTDWSAITDAQFKAAADWLREAHKNVASYWADPADMAQIMGSGAVDVAWSWNDGVVNLKNDNYPVGFKRDTKEGWSSFFCGFVNLKEGPGSEDKMYQFINAWLEPQTGPALLETIGYGISTSDGMALISEEEKAAAGIEDIAAPVLAQTPNDSVMREKQLAEFEKIKAGF